MTKAHTYSEVCSVLATRFKEAYRRKDVNLTGLVFAIPESPFAKAEIIPYVDYWHHRSDNETDFFCAGFGAFGPGEYPVDKDHVEGIGHDNWWFSAQFFMKFVGEIEARTAWTHSGATDVIIATARFDQAIGKASLDFRSAVAINLDEARKDKAIGDAPQLMQTIFQCAAKLNEYTQDPAWGYSDRMGLKNTRPNLKDWLLSFLPGTFGKGARKALHVAARDISPKTPLTAL